MTHLTPLEQILFALVIMFASATVGSYFGKKGKMSENTCDERRQACFMLVTQKIDDLKDIVIKLEKTVNNKLLGI